MARAVRDASDVDVSHGDIFDLKADAIVSPANSFGFMDGGIDLAYSLRFGWSLQDRLRESLRLEHDGELPVGQAVIVPTDHTDIPYLISAPTMRIPMDVSDSVNAYLAFRGAIRVARDHNRTAARPIKTILCSGLATGVGCLPYPVCALADVSRLSHAHCGKAWTFDTLGSAMQSHAAMV
jgi:O-acetyl-ADP-ribose deacetylase (regulator of RNase III)